MKQEIIVLDPRQKRLASLVQRALVRIAKALTLENVHVAVYLVGDRHMKKNVLAYPAPKDFPRPDLKKYQSIGEIYLNPSYIKQHNEDFIFMLIHGLLHLLGYDHHTRHDTIAMEKKEKELLQLL